MPSKRKKKKKKKRNPEHVFGDFQCSQCYRTWKSFKSWENGQQCTTCKINVYPHTERTGRWLTPWRVQNQRVFGEFECLRCKRPWMSGNSWADFGQECLRCTKITYPHTQRRLEGGGGGKVQHPEEYCEKCQELGYCCREEDNDYESDYY